MDTPFLIDSNATQAVNDCDDLADVNSADFGGYETLQMQPFVQTVGYVCLCVYIVVVAIGIPANIFVVFRMLRLARNDNEKYTNGTGLGLLSMATADLFALILVLVQNVLVSMPLDASGPVKAVICKVLLFSTHTVTSVSIWSWLLLSTLRYLAVRHPLFHLRLWEMPYRAVALIILLSSLTNVWLLVAVDHHETGCIMNEEDFNRYLLLIESVWSFCIPVIMIIYMDATVLICQPHKFISADITPRKRTDVQQRPKRVKSTLWKWLLISFIDVLLNTPENVYRLVMLLGKPQAGPGAAEYQFAAQMIAQVLYFAQFAFNSIYLALFVFDKNIKPRALSVTNYTHSELSIAATPTPNVTCRRQHSQRAQRCYAKENILMLPRTASCLQLEVVIAHV